MRLVKTNPINHKSLNSNHWLSKRHDICMHVITVNYIIINEIESNCNCWYKCHDVSTTSDWNLMIYGSLDSSLQDASNRSIFMSLGLIDGKLLAIYCLKTFVNNFSFINPKDIKILRLDASSYDESNEP